MKPCCLPLLVVLALAPPCLSRTWHILPDGSGDAPTIQAGVDSASTGDVVELAPGEYMGDGNQDVDFLGKAITVRSANLDPTEVLIYPGGHPYDGHRGFLFVSGEGPTSVLEGVTVLYGQTAPPFPGGALFCQQSSPTIRGCHFKYNYSIDEAPCIAIQDGSPVIAECSFVENGIDQGGGSAIYSSGEGHAIVTGCYFSGNANGGYAGAILAGAQITIVDCVFSGNYAYRGGGALWLADVGLVDGCVFSDNATGLIGGAILVGGDVAITSCTFVHNRSFYGSEATGVHVFDGGSVSLEAVVLAFGIGGFAVSGAATLECCDLFGNDGGNWTPNIAAQYNVNGNFSADPMFCGDENPEDPYTLFNSSPCLPGNHPQGEDCGVIGARGAGCQAIGTTPQTWARVKAKYR